jgi:hypothetical protein
MHVNQAIFPLSMFNNTDNTANSLYAFVCLASADEPEMLIDDHWYESARPPLSTKITPREGMLFWAKDGDTLKRGLAKAGTYTPKEEWDLSGGYFDITACGLTWDLGSVAMQSKATIAIKTIGFNMKLLLKPERVQRQVKTEMNTSFGRGHGFKTETRTYRPYQSVSNNVKNADANRKLVQRGAAVLVVQTDKMRRGQENGKNSKFGDQYGHWGGEFRQIGSDLSLSTLSSLVSSLL